MLCTSASPLVMLTTVDAASATNVKVMPKVARTEQSVSAPQQLASKMLECSCDDGLATNFEFDARGTGNPRKVSRDSTRVGTVAALALPQDEKDCAARSRKRELEERKAVYVWDFTYNDGRTFPIATGLPECEVSGVAHVLDALSHTFAIGLTALYDAAKDKVRNFGKRQNKIESIKNLYREGTLPRTMEGDKWRTDEEFGRQRLQGMYPKMVRKLDRAKPDFQSLMAKFPVASVFANFATLIGAPSSFDDAVKAGHLYYIDYQLLDNVDSPPERNLTAPIALFYDDKVNKCFLPLAIQLGQDPVKHCIFTPRTQASHGESSNAWLAAKIHFQVAEAQYHGVLGHLLHTHWVSETTYTAMRRNLSSRHPVHELLYPHFWFTLVIEFGARHFLIAESNPLPSLLAMGFKGQNNIMDRGWKDFSFKQLSIHDDVEERGAQDISNYYFYEDGKRIWAVIEKYVRAMVENFYPTAATASIANDHELQAWYEELRSPSVCGIKDLPEFWNANHSAFIATREHLVQFLTSTLFNVSAGHAAVNNSQWDHLGCPVNMPGTYHMAPPTSPDQPITDSEIANAFPNLKDTIVQMAMFRGLTTATYRPLGWYHQEFFAGRPEVAPIVGQFRAEIDEVSMTITKDNENPEKRRHPYTYLDPRQVAMGIAI
jgi:hypothetical protein